MTEGFWRTRLLNLAHCPCFQFFPSCSAPPRVALARSPDSGFQSFPSCSEPEGIYLLAEIPSFFQFFPSCSPQVPDVQGLPEVVQGFQFFPSCSARQPFSRPFFDLAFNSFPVAASELRCLERAALPSPFQFFPSCSREALLDPARVRKVLLAAFNSFPVAAKAPASVSSGTQYCSFQFFPSCSPDDLAGALGGPQRPFNSFPVAAGGGRRRPAPAAPPFNSFPVAARREERVARGQIGVPFNSFPVAACLRTPSLKWKEQRAFNSFPVAAPSPRRSSTTRR